MGLAVVGSEVSSRILLCHLEGSGSVRRGRLSSAGSTPGSYRGSMQPGQCLQKTRSRSVNSHTSFMHMMKAERTKPVVGLVAV